MLFTDAVYAKLKFIALVLLPALVAAYYGLSQIWHFPNVEQVMGTIAVLDTFLGALLGLSTKTYNAGTLQQPKDYEGTIYIEPSEEGGTDQLRFSELNLSAIGRKKEVSFRVIQPPG